MLTHLRTGLIRSNPFLLLAFALTSAACYSAANGATSEDDAGATTEDANTASDSGAEDQDPPSALFDGPTTCSSGAHWTGGDRESPLMHPGGACVSCHVSAGGPKLLVGGTVFATGHEPVDCNGQKPSTPVTITLTGSDGKSQDLAVNASGNFFLYARGGSLATPFTAKITRADQSYVMHTPQTSGDCNSCHTVDGANGARGRIVAP